MFYFCFFLEMVILKNQNIKKKNFFKEICIHSCIHKFSEININHMCRLTINKPIEYNNPMPSPNFEFPVFEAEEKEIPDEISRLLKHEERAILPHKEPLEKINLGSEEDKKEVTIGSLLDTDVNSKLTDLLKEYVDVFAWSYQDMPGMDTNIVQHYLPLKPECPPVKQKLRRTHPDMANKIKIRSSKATRRRVSCHLRVSAMVGQHSASSEERWQGQNVC